MPIIDLETKINAPIERVFDLSRSIDLHVESTVKTNERAVGGRTSGLIERGETVTWEAVHFGMKQRLTSKIVVLDRPHHFRDSMQKGIFSRLVHDHYFADVGRETVMRDVFDFESPFWIFGKIAQHLFLENYLRRFLVERNQLIQQTAEGDNWKKFLPN